MPSFSHYTAATDTTEIVLPRFARALPDTFTQEIHMPYLKPEVRRVRRGPSASLRLWTSIGAASFSAAVLFASSVFPW